MFRDVLHHHRPATLRFDGVKGTAYRVFAARGDLFLLTSAGMYVFYTLASRFLAGERVVGTPTSVREFSAEAVDAGIVFDRYLLIVIPDEVLRFDLDLFTQLVPRLPSRLGIRSGIAYGSRNQVGSTACPGIRMPWGDHLSLAARDLHRFLGCISQQRPACRS